MMPEANQDANAELNAERKEAEAEAKKEAKAAAKDKDSDKDAKTAQREKKAHNRMQAVGAYFRDTRAEFKKIVWPTRKLVVNNTLIVLGFILVVGAFIWLLDFGTSSLLKFLLGKM